MSVFEVFEENYSTVYYKFHEKEEKKTSSMTVSALKGCGASLEKVGRSR